MLSSLLKKVVICRLFKMHGEVRTLGHNEKHTLARCLTCGQDGRIVGSRFEA